MAEIKITISGIYPKLIESPDVPHFKRKLHAFDSKKISAEDLEEVVKKNTNQMLKEQREAGVSILGDGMIRWDDFYSPFAKAWTGLKRDTLKRIFDTNTLQRKPRVSEEIKYQESTVVKDAAYALSQLAEGEILKVSLPGPISFAKDCDNEYYNDFNKLTLDIAKALNQALLAYQSAGIQYVEVYDPYLHFEEIDSALLEEAYKILLQGVDSTKVIIGCFYGTLLAKNLEEVSKSNISGLSVDLVTDEESLNNLPVNTPGIIQVGLFDARTTASDDLEEAKKRLQKVTEKYPDKEIWISLNNNSEFLPRDRAVRKIGRLKEV